MSTVRDMTIESIPDSERNRLQAVMRDAYIPAMSTASFSSGHIQASAFGVTDVESNTNVALDTQFWACSLSKSVFAFLVIRLIEEKILPPNFLNEKLPWDTERLGDQGSKESFTPRMLLSHQTGLPNEGPPDSTFQEFNAGNFRYSGEGYGYLQRVIEKMTGKSLEELAQDNVFRPLGMSRTSFLFPEKETNLAKTHDEAMVPNPLPKMHENDNNAAASLHTTASDYMRFLIACLNHKDFLEIITPQINNMEKKDIVANANGINEAVLKPIDWGLGFGLQKDEQGKITAAFHWGHGPGARNFFAINPEQKTAVVCLTNSDNGLDIDVVNNIARPIVGDVAPIMDFLSKKYGYENYSSESWQKYHENLIRGIAAEKEKKFEIAISCYREAIKFCSTPQKEAELQYRIMLAEAKQIQDNVPVNPNIEDLKKLSGQYGQLKMSVVASTLQINDGGPGGPRDLKQINHNTFMDGAIILKFNQDEGKNTASLTCNFPNGSKPSFPYLTPPRRGELYPRADQANMRTVTVEDKNSNSSDEENHVRNYSSPSPFAGAKKFQPR